MTVLKETTMDDLNEHHVASMNELFDALVSMILSSELPRQMVQSVLAKVLVINALDHTDKDDFLEGMGKVYDFESFMHPDSDEVH